MSFYKIQKEDIMVIFDDISLEPGKIRFREK
jgi:peptidyl-tRNA hydrolase